MSSISSSIPASGSAGPALIMGDASGRTIDLNVIFREVMKKHNGIRQKLKLVMRCNSLPVTNGDAGRITQVFDALLSSIIAGFTPQALPFLYIDCEETTDAEKGEKQHRIRFNANIKSLAQWQEANNDTLRQCEQLLYVQGSRLIINNESSSGCLFSIILPSNFE